ncbi:MAG: hypothetical protein CVV35_00800 [Methanomicrobiales archaeon HGW-Methanomicrobiales-6]|jgi:hypothetical protein|nr:MAG: hypothetical protein CVV35_00800 [Methanomicrobiales archaeon HGW-Methanomicrobiales-6]
MLFAMVERYNVACNAITPVAFSERQLSERELQARVHSTVRETEGRPAQVALLAPARLPAVTRVPERRSGERRFKTDINHVISKWNVMPHTVSCPWQENGLVDD